MIKAIKTWLKYFLLSLMSLINKYCCRKLNESGFRILIFHNIKEDQWSNFKDLIEYISKKYGFITPKEAENYLAGRHIINGTKYLISFDDGFLADAQLYKKILEPAGLKALFFICPVFVGMEGELAKDFIVNNLFAGKISREAAPGYLPMGWEDVKYLSEKGNIIGAHTMNHARLALIENIKEKEYEIIECKKELGEHLGCEVEWFTYPFGDIGSIDERSLKIIQKNYRFCCSGLRGLNTRENDLHGLSRDAVDLCAPIKYSRLLVSGCFDRFYSSKIIKLKEYLRA